MTTVVQAIVVPEPEPEPEPELEPKSDGISYPEPTGVHVQPGGGIRATLSELDECACLLLPSPRRSASVPDHF
jgi:hypothetical protein